MEWHNGIDEWCWTMTEVMVKVEATMIEHAKPTSTSAWREFATPPDRVLRVFPLSHVIELVCGVLRLPSLSLSLVFCPLGHPSSSHLCCSILSREFAILRRNYGC